MRIVCDIDAAARASPCSAARCIDCDAACRAPAQRLMTDSYFACYKTNSWRAFGVGLTTPPGTGIREDAPYHHSLLAASELMRLIALHLQEEAEERLPTAKHLPAGFEDDGTFWHEGV